MDNCNAGKPTLEECAVGPVYDHGRCTVFPSGLPCSRFLQGYPVFLFGDKLDFYDQW